MWLLLVVVISSHLRTQPLLPHFVNLHSSSHIVPLVMFLALVSILFLISILSLILLYLRDNLALYSVTVRRTGHSQLSLHTVHLMTLPPTPFYLSPPRHRTMIFCSSSWLNFLNLTHVSVLCSLLPCGLSAHLSQILTHLRRGMLRPSLFS